VARKLIELEPEAEVIFSGTKRGLEGRIVPREGFPLEMIRLDLCTQFQQKVLRAEHGIPRGRVSTYQRIARHIGNAKGARAVGTALAKNPFPIIIPCHRAVRSDGTLGGYQGGVDMKRALLEMEGVYADTNDRVPTTAFFY
jgi:methylated-DNA-[protein]-cysteine S-methyltransferase